MKDPAFLFYYQDFLVGTEFMTHEERGIYITMICHLADKGFLSREHMHSICKGCAFSSLLISKFTVDENGNYFNKRLRAEMEKRRLYTESRRKNAKAYAQHMENENENENINVVKDKKAFNLPTIEEVRAYCKERGNDVDPSKWHNFYSAKGWMIGKNKMKDWKAAVRTWETKHGIVKVKPPEYKTCPEDQEKVSKMIKETLSKMEAA